MGGEWGGGGGARLCICWAPPNTLNGQFPELDSYAVRTESRYPCSIERPRLCHHRKPGWCGPEGSCLHCPPQPHPRRPAGTGRVGFTLDISSPCYTFGATWKKGLYRDSALPALQVLPCLALPSLLGAQFNSSEWEVKMVWVSSPAKAKQKDGLLLPLHLIACTLFQNFLHSSSSSPRSLQGLARGSLYKSCLYPHFGLWSLLLSMESPPSSAAQTRS